MTPRDYERAKRSIGPPGDVRSQTTCQCSEPRHTARRMASGPWAKGGPCGDERAESATVVLARRSSEAVGALELSDTVDPRGVYEHRGSSFGPHSGVVGVPVIVGAAGGEEDVAQQESQVLRVDAIRWIVWTDHFARTVHADPAPLGAPECCYGWVGTQGAQLDPAIRHEPDNRLAGERMFEDPRVDQRRVWRAVWSNHTDRAEAVILRDHRADQIEIVVHGCQVCQAGPAMAPSRMSVLGTSADGPSVNTATCAHLRC